MTQKSPVFETHLNDYLRQVARLDVSAFVEKLGGCVRDKTVSIPFWGKEYRVGNNEILDPAGKQADYGVSVLLCKYLLLCPEGEPVSDQWRSFKDFKSAAPLISYFSANVEGAISTHFSGRTKALSKAVNALDGRPPAMDLSYDISACFHALPKVPLLLLFNDADGEFGANCSVLFEKRAEDYLDMECLAIVGALFAQRLKAV
jgi:hypothetical protein